jgi:uncharacterized coiled-coil protein SlyX
MTDDLVSRLRASGSANTLEAAKEIENLRKQNDALLERLNAALDENYDIDQRLTKAEDKMNKLQVALDVVVNRLERKQ